MPVVEDLLEASLLELGGQERELEQLIVELRNEAKRALQARDLSRVEVLRTTIDEIRAEMVPLQSEIMQVELKLYGLRRKKCR